MLKSSVPRLRGVGAQAGQHLELVVFSEEEGHVKEGILFAAGRNEWYPIRNGVPCFLVGALQPDLDEFASRHQLPPRSKALGRSGATEQAKTSESFSDKWRRFRNYGLEPEHQKFLFRWYCLKLGVPDEAALRTFYRHRQKVLEVGPGSGFNTRFISENCRNEVFALDVSDAAFTTFDNTRHLRNCTVVQADLMDAPFDDEAFDFIIADGVLHHTPDTREAVRALYKKLMPGGQFFFYVYRKMGAARHFADSHIREAFKKLPPERCYLACEGITDLGRELSRLNAKITLSRPIEVLGIPAGTHDIQRLLYYNFVKCFWNEAFDFETNNMVNFDWYHPHHAWQHDDEEVRRWLDELGVTEFAFHDANPNGISVLLRKPA